MFTIKKSRRPKATRKLRPTLIVSAFLAIVVVGLVLHYGVISGFEKNRVPAMFAPPKSPVIDDFPTLGANPAGWKFKTPKHYPPHVLYEFSDARPAVIHTVIPGNGENGEQFDRVDESDPEMKRLQDEHNYNLMATEMMSLHRSLPDYRCDECKQMRYPKRLPKTTFILIFHNEAWSLILRSVWSIIERSPRQLIEEIILVDDVSDWPVLRRPMQDYVELLPVRVRLIRTTKREGLIRARLIGAEAAKGQVLVFFDAHVEVTDGWLEPLLTNIAEDRSLVAVPHIDWISSATLKFEAIEWYQFSRYTWGLGLYWTNYPERELKRINHSKTALIRLPTHVGCAFAVDREFFYEIGSYDEGMDIWGSENLDLALRAWLCGGSLQLVQCSRIGHFFRVSTYSFNGSQDKIITRNSKRLAEVWLDDAKELLYAIYPNMRNIDAGDITERRNLRQRLQCKSFQWYLENIYPESLLRYEYIAFGEIKTVADGRCIDSYDTSIGTKVIVFDCHKDGGNQFIALRKDGLMITSNQDFCVGISNDNSTILTPTIVTCAESDRSQRWQYDVEAKTIQHAESGLCMYTVGDKNGIELVKCDAGDPSFKWLLGPAKKLP